MQIRDGVFSERHPVFICAPHLEPLTCSSHCTICDICSRLHYQAEARTVKGSRSEGEATIMTSLACSALATMGPGVLLRRGTHGCAPFSQHSACNIVFSTHNATLHTGFITPCQSAGGIRGISAGAAGATALYVEQETWRCSSPNAAAALLKPPPRRCLRMQLFIRSGAIVRYRAAFVVVFTCHC